MAKFKKKPQQREMAVDKMDVLNKVNAMLVQLGLLQIEWFLVLTDQEGQLEIRGSTKGETFLKKCVDVTERFTQHCSHWNDNFQNTVLTMTDRSQESEICPSESLNNDSENVAASYSPEVFYTSPRERNRPATRSTANHTTGSGVSQAYQKHKSIHDQRNKTSVIANAKTCRATLDNELKKGACRNDNCSSHSNDTENLQSKCSSKYFHKRKALMTEKKTDQAQDKAGGTKSETVKFSKVAIKIEPPENSLNHIEELSRNICEKNALFNISTEPEQTNNAKEESVESSECEICDKIFSVHKGTKKIKFEPVTRKFDGERASLELLKSVYHKSKHTGNDKTVLTCPICSKEMTSLKAMIEHFEQIHSHGFTKGQCSKIIFAYCNIMRQTKENLSKINTNEEQTSSAKQNASSYFNDEEQSKFRMKQNIKKHYRKKALLCDLCGKVFFGIFKLKRHLMSHYPNYKCDFKNCDKSFANETSLVSHKRRHCQKYMFMCSVCGKTCPTKCKLNSHMKYHAEDRLLKCDDCGKSFKTKDVLTKHQRIHKSMRHYYCEICGHGFNQSGAMQRHLLVHTNLKPHKCSICGQEYRNAASLKSHKLRANHYDHDEEKNIPTIKCDECGKVFLTSLRHEYKRHLLTHTGEKPYPCTICHKSFSDKSNLRQHIKMHKDDRPYSCSVCGKRFIQQRSLRNHQLVSGHIEVDNNNLDKPNTWHKPYGNKDNLQIHIKKAHQDEKKVSCTDCDESFTQQGGLHKDLILSGHGDKSHKDRIETSIQNGIEKSAKDKGVQKTPNKEGPTMSNFELLHAAVSHVEKCVKKTGANEMEFGKPEKTPEIMPKDIRKSRGQKHNEGQANHCDNDPDAGDSKLNSISESETLNTHSTNNKLNSTAESGNNFETLNNLSTNTFLNQTTADTGNVLCKPHGYRMFTLKTNLDTDNKSNMQTCSQNMLPNSQIILLRKNSKPVIVPLIQNASSASNIPITDYDSRNIALTKLSSSESFSDRGTKIDVLNSLSGSRPEEMQNIITYSVKDLQKNDFSPENVIQNMNSENNFKEDSNAGQTIVKTFSDSGKVPDPQSDSKSTMQSRNFPSETMAVNTDSYEIGNAFVDSPSKSHFDTENTFLQTNTGSGNTLMNIPIFLNEDPFSQSVYFSKASTNEPNFDPVYYSGSTSSLAPVDVWPTSVASPSPELQQDTRYTNMEQIYTLPFTSASADDNTGVEMEYTGTSL